jgi:hypothetical protein
MSPANRAAAAAAFGLAAVISYALQRLAAAAFDPVEASSVLLQAHLPYFWRVGLALLHGAGFASLALVAPEGAAARALPLLARATPIGVAAAAVAMLAVP